MSDLSVYDEVLARSKAAYAAFKEYYAARNPPPVKSELSRDYVSLLITVGLVVLMIASIIVSGSRTIPEFGGGFIGVVAFIMLEGGIMGYAFFYARRNINENKLKDARRLAVAGLGLTVIIALGANLDEALRQHGVILPDEIRTVVNVMVALSAPGLAFISSDVLAIELMAGDLRQRQADKEFQIIFDEWQDGLNRSWASQQKQWGVKVEIENPPSSVSVQPVQLSDGQDRTIGHGVGYKRESKAASIVLKHLDEHPEDLQLPVRELADKLKIGKSTVASVIKSMRE